MSGKKNTITKCFHENCSKHLEKIALIFDDEIFTYESLLREVSNIANNLLKDGITKGSKVAIILPNCREYIFLYFALFEIGAIAVPCNTKWELPELRRILFDAKVDAVVYKQVIGVIDFGQSLDTIEDEDALKFKRYELTEEKSEKGKNVKELLADVENMEKPMIEPDDIAMISYTSGTTGTPKGVVMRNDSLVVVSQCSAKIYGIGDTPLSIAPLYAAQGFSSLLIQFSMGGYMTYMSSFNPNDILKRISKKENSIIHTQPTMWNMLLQNRLIDFTDFTAIKKVVVSGSLCAPELAKKIEEKIGCQIINTYGLIEATSAVTSTRIGDSEEIRYNTVGRPIEGVTIKIVDDNRQEIKKGEVGELAVQGYLMSGYYHNKQFSDEVLEDGWLFTGDLAKYYDEENISIVGRKKDMIIRGGFNIYPSDIENCLIEHSDIMDVAVVEKKHDVVGEIIVAYIVKKPFVELTEGDIYRFCRQKLSNYKIPDEVHFIKRMPTILAGKVDKKILRKWAETGEYEDE